MCDGRFACLPAAAYRISTTSWDSNAERLTHLLDVVALLADVPSQGLVRGQVGTVVELLNTACEVEFSDDEGKTYAELALPPDQLLVLHHCPQRAA